MSKTNAINILSQIEDMTENVIATEGKADDKQLLKEIKAAIKWVNKASVARPKNSGLHLQNVNVGAFLFKVKDTTYELINARSYNEAVTKLELLYPGTYWEYLTEFRHSR